MVIAKYLKFRCNQTIPGGVVELVGVALGVPTDDMEDVLVPVDELALVGIGTPPLVLVEMIVVIDGKAGTTVLLET